MLNSRYRILKNLLYVYGSNLILGLLGVFLIPFALHRLGKDGFGVLSIYTAIVALISLLDLGVTKDYVRRHAAAENSREQQIISRQVLNFYLHLFIAVLFICLPLAYINSNYLFVIENRDNVFIISILCCLEFCLGLPISYILAFNTSKEEFGRISSYNTFSGILRYIILFGGIYFSIDIIKIITILSLRRIIELVLTRLFLILPDREMWKLGGDLKRSWLILKNSSILAVSQILQTIMITSGTYLVNQSYGLQALANYRASFDLANRIWFFSNGLGLVIFPRLVKIEAGAYENKDKDARLSRAVMSSWTAYSFMIVIGALSSKAIFSLFGIHDTEIISLFCLLLCGVAINAHSNLSYEILQARGRFLNTIVLSGTSLVMLIVFYFVLEKKLGYFAIGYSWIISQIFYSFWIDQKAVNLSICNNIYKFIITFIVLWLLVYAMRIINL